MMKVRKGFTSLLFVLALVGISSPVQGGDMFKLNSIKKTSFTRTRGDPIKHGEA